MEHDNRATNDASDGPLSSSPSQASTVQATTRRSSLAVGIRHASALEQPGAAHTSPGMHHDSQYQDRTTRVDEAATSEQDEGERPSHGQQHSRRLTCMRSTECDMELPVHAERHVERHLARVSANFELQRQSMASVHGNGDLFVRRSSPLPLDPKSVAAAVGPRPSTKPTLFGNQKRQFKVCRVRHTAQISAHRARARAIL